MSEVINSSNNKFEVVTRDHEIMIKSPTLCFNSDIENSSIDCSSMNEVVRVLNLLCSQYDGKTNTFY